MVNVVRAVGFAVLAVLSIGSVRAQNADFRLSLAGVDSQRRPTLSMSGLTAGRYVLQASTNLSQWFSITSAPVGAEPLSFVHPEAAQLGTVYYRGLHQPDDAPAIIPQVDSNFVASGLITISNGGTLALTNVDGVRYSFIVGPSNVIDTVAVRMQLVTNFSSFPYSNEMRTAILFEPSGFEFHGAGVLEIVFPTNVPSLKISSFAFGADGQGFHLTPDVVASNRVRIPVTHFSGVGTGLWAPTDRTAAVTTFVNNREDQLAQELAGIIGKERDRLDQGEQPQLDLASELQSREKDYYDNYLKPFFAEAEKDCALAMTLSKKLLGMERQSQLLGLTNSPAASFLGSETAKKWDCNCLNEAIKACKEGQVSDKTLLRTLLGAERMSQLLSGGSALDGCGVGSLDDFMEQALTNKLPCAPDWIGVVSYTDGGSRNWDCSGDGAGGGSCDAFASVALNFEADVERVTLEDESFPPFFTKQIWRLKLFPEGNGSFSRRSHSSVSVPGGATIETTRQLNGANSGPIDIDVTFTFEDGELTDFVIDTAPNGGLAVNWSEIATGVTSACSDGTGGSSSSHTFQGSISLTAEGATMEDVTFTRKTTTALEGTVTGIRIGVEGILMPYSWKFSFRRNGS